MRFLDKIERKLGFLAFQNLTLYLIIGQVAMFGLASFSPNPELVLGNLVFTWERFLAGEFWRIFTFVLIPPQTYWLFLVFAWLIFYMMGSFLEQHWGTFRYNLYLLVGVLGALLSGLIHPYYPVLNHYLGLSIWFGFAYLNPNYELRIYFILPVKVKWIAFFSLGLLVLQFVGSSFVGKVIIIGSLLNFPLFFGADILRRFRSKQRVSKMKAEREKLEQEPFHTCSICGATDISDPDLDFRYRKEGAICSRCLATEEENSSKS